MKLDNITIFKDDDGYIAIFINSIKVYETSGKCIKLNDILQTITMNSYYVNNQIVV